MDVQSEELRCFDLRLKLKSGGPEKNPAEGHPNTKSGYWARITALAQHIMPHHEIIIDA
jgi:hypothetical protein